MESAELIEAACRILGLEEPPAIETSGAQYDCLGILLELLRARLAELDMEAESLGYGPALVALQDRLDTVEHSYLRRPEAASGKPGWVSQAFWDATDPRLP